MDYYTLRKIVEALRVKIKGNRLKDVREREHIVELVFKKVSLLFSLYPEKLGIYFFDNPFLDEGEKGLFSKNLANYVGGFRLEDICIVEGDRIVEFHFLRSDPLGRAKRLVLVYELLGKFANLILLEDNVIRLVKREVETDRRVVIPGRIYFRPPIADKGERPLYPFTKDIEKELNFREVKSIEKDLFSPYVWVSGGKIYPFSPSFCNAERIDDVIAFLAADFGDFYERRNFETKKSELAHVLKKRIEKLREVVLKSKIEVPSDKEIEDLYRWGVTLFTCYKEAVRDGDNYIIPDPYSEGDFLKVPIEVELDPISLANYYFEKRSLLKKKKAHLSKRLADFELEVKWLEEMLWDLENAKELEDLNRIAEILAEVGLLKEGSKKVYGKSTDDRNNYTEFDYGKYKVYVGRNARGNEYVTFKLAKPNDLWFHVKDYPGAHVVVRVVTDFNEEDLKKVAGIALYYSKVRSAGKGDVDYTYVRNVKKIRGKVGMVTYKDYKTVRVEVYKPEGEDHD